MTPALRQGKAQALGTANQAATAVGLLLLRAVRCVQAGKQAPRTSSQHFSQTFLHVNGRLQEAQTLDGRCSLATPRGICARPC